MKNHSRKTLTILLLLLLSSLGRVEGFSLGGPFTTWQVSTIGYNNFDEDLTGPMNISEEYRLTLPIYNYAFDATFLNYFGSNGERAINDAFDILNRIPSANAINLADFPLQAKGPINFTAQNLNLFDMKSYTLGTMMAQMGLGAPERFTWCLRNRAVVNGVTNYIVIQRNFDPVQPRVPSAVVNGTLYSYFIFDPVPLTNSTISFADAVESLVDPLASDFTSLAGVDNRDPARSPNLGPGEYFTGLTREDAAAFKYIYSENNYNIEDPPTGTTLSTNSFVGGSPWIIPGAGFTTNTTMVTTALRQGIGAIRFNRVVFDSLVGTVLNVTNEFTDTFITNGVVGQQILQRVLVAPDILISAGDLGVDPTGLPILRLRTLPSGWQDNSALNTVGIGEIYGPGVITGDIEISFSRLGPYRINSTPFFLDENFSFSGLALGHFDTANIFAVFPAGSGIEEIESRIGSGETTDGGTNPSPFGP